MQHTREILEGYFAFIDVKGETLCFVLRFTFDEKMSGEHFLVLCLMHVNIFCIKIFYKLELEEVVCYI